MYTLRTISKNGEQQNVNLGNNYSLIDRDSNKENFVSAYNNVYVDLVRTDEQINPEVYGIVTSNEFGARHFLYKENFYYVMTESGKTFSNLTYK